jgi:hypothetical protein
MAFHHKRVLGVLAVLGVLGVRGSRFSEFQVLGVLGSRGSGFSRFGFEVLEVPVLKFSPLAGSVSRSPGGPSATYLLRTREPGNPRNAESRTS